MRGFGIANYRSFSAEGAWMPDLSRINIFIGKNNAGKSNILKFLRDLSASMRGIKNNGFDAPELKHWSEGDPPAIDLSVTLKEMGIAWNQLGFQLEGHGLRSEDKTNLRIRFDPLNRQCGPIDPFEEFKTKPEVYRRLWNRFGIHANSPSSEQIKQSLSNRYPDIFQHIVYNEFRDVFYVQQFREIRDGDGETEERQVAGYKLAERLGFMKSPGESRNAEQAQFYKIQTWIKKLLDLPDLEIEIEHHSGEKPNAVLLKANGLRRYLESFGTGLHQLVILCFAISLKKKHIVCIEEPESFLHPTLQRRFLEFLRKTDNTYFLSTHSNVFLDAAKQNDTRIYHVGYEGKASKVTRVETTPDSYRVLEDLGYHASDLLQSNGVIWVEGPTDRLYLLKWLELFGCEAKEDLDFTIMFYGGRLLSHVSFNAELDKELIPMLRLNRNAIVILDSERTFKGQHLKKSRKELIEKIEAELKSTTNHLVWVTQGRDIENYIAEDALKKFGQAKWNEQFRLKYNSFLTLDEMLKWGKTRRRTFNYSDAKVEYCRAIVQHFNDQHLDVLDLKSKLTKISAIIDAWCPKRIQADVVLS
jgi:ABC-type oligopeptide transport system ATPase subunit